MSIIHLHWTSTPIECFRMCKIALLTRSLCLSAFLCKYLGDNCCGGFVWEWNIDVVQSPATYFRGQCRVNKAFCNSHISMCWSMMMSISVTPPTTRTHLPLYKCERPSPTNQIKQSICNGGHWLRCSCWDVRNADTGGMLGKLQRQIWQNDTFLTWKIRCFL